MSKVRKDYFSESFVLFTNEKLEKIKKLKKVVKKKDCPYCPGNEHITGPADLVLISKEGALAKLVDDKLIWEVDSVKDVVSLGRSARNKANIKIRQPLEILAGYGNEDILKIARDNQVEILEELNIKSMNLVENEAELVSFIVKPNFH